MELTERQRGLLRACVEAELDAGDSGDTALQVLEIERAVDVETASDEACSMALNCLRGELRELRDMLHGMPNWTVYG